MASPTKDMPTPSTSDLMPDPEVIPNPSAVTANPVETLDIETTIGVNIRVTAHQHQGGRRYMEDMLCVAYQPTSNDKDLLYAYFGVFDGHGGKEAAMYTKRHLMDNIVKQKNFWEDEDSCVLRAIHDGFLITHHAMLKELSLSPSVVFSLNEWPKTASGLPSTSGTTATMAFVRRSKLYIGHVGDSGLILGYQDPESGYWKAKSLTTEHKPENPIELARINRSGGKVVRKAGVPRVVWNRPRVGHQGPVRRSTAIESIPFLAVARSLGDFWSYNAESNEFVVSPEPDVCVVNVDVANFRCLIFGSDGLWNMLNPQEAVNSVYCADKNNERQVLASPPATPSTQVKNWINPSKRLVDRALERWYHHNLRADNTSVITVVIDKPGASKTRSTVYRPPYRDPAWQASSEQHSPTARTMSTSMTEPGELDVFMELDDDMVLEDFPEQSRPPPVLPTADTPETNLNSSEASASQSTNKVERVESVSSVSSISEALNLPTTGKTHRPVLRARRPSGPALPPPVVASSTVQPRCPVSPMRPASTQPRETRDEIVSKAVGHEKDSGKNETLASESLPLKQNIETIVGDEDKPKDKHSETSSESRKRALLVADSLSTEDILPPFKQRKNVNAADKIGQPQPMAASSTVADSDNLKLDSNRSNANAYNDEIDGTVFAKVQIHEVTSTPVQISDKAADLGVQESHKDVTSESQGDEHDGKKVTEEHRTSNRRTPRLTALNKVQSSKSNGRMKINKCKKINTMEKKPTSLSELRVSPRRRSGRLAQLQIQVHSPSEASKPSKSALIRKPLPGNAGLEDEAIALTLFKTKSKTPLDQMKDKAHPLLTLPILLTEMDKEALAGKRETTTQRHVKRDGKQTTKVQKSRRSARGSKMAKTLAGGKTAKILTERKATKILPERKATKLLTGSKRDKNLAGSKTANILTGTKTTKILTGSKTSKILTRTQRSSTATVKKSTPEKLIDLKISQGCSKKKTERHTGAQRKRSKNKQNGTVKTHGRNMTTKVKTEGNIDEMKPAERESKRVTRQSASSSFVGKVMTQQANTPKLAGFEPTTTKKQVAVVQQDSARRSIKKTIKRLKTQRRTIEGKSNPIEAKERGNKRVTRLTEVNSAAPVLPTTSVAQRVDKRKNSRKTILRTRTSQEMHEVKGSEVELFQKNMGSNVRPRRQRAQISTAPEETTEPSQSERRKTLITARNRRSMERHHLERARSLGNAKDNVKELRKATPRITTVRTGRRGMTKGDKTVSQDKIIGEKRVLRSSLSSDSRVTRAKTDQRK